MFEVIEEADKIELNDRYNHQQLMGDPPGWLLRYGIGMIFVLIGVAATIVWFVEYPDMVPTEVTLSTENPPIPVVSEANGKLVELAVKNEQAVSLGDYLGMIESTASKADVTLLDNLLGDMGEMDASEVAAVQLPSRLKLGPIQATFSTFKQSIKDYKNYQKTNRNYKKIRNLNAQIASIRAQNATFDEKEIFLTNQKSLAIQQYNRVVDLRNQGIAADVDVEEKLNAVNQIDREIKDNQIQRDRNNNTKLQLKGQIINLEENQGADLADKKRAVTENIDNLIAEIADWRKMHLIHAPIDGVVAFSNIRKTQQFISAGEQLLTIVPAGTNNEIIATAMLNARGAGKVEVADSVNIKLQDFPFKEFGMLKGVVQNIALVPNEEGYLVEIGIPENFVSTTQKPLTFRQGMKGAGNIITDDRRLVERILSEFRGLWERK